MIFIDDQTCMGCNLCVMACPEHAISCYGLAQVDLGKCNGCSICVRYCPVSAIAMRKDIA